MATTLTINLSEALQNRLSQTTATSQVNVWAVYFTTAGPQATQLAVHGGGAPAAATSISLPNPDNGGKVYLLIQSIDTSVPASPAALTFGPTGTIKQESDISWQGAETNQYRYDSFELSLLGSAADAGNLTDVEAFGLPMSVEIQYPNGATTQTRGYGVTGSKVFSDIGDAFKSGGGLLHEFKYGPLAGTTREAAAPATALGKGVGGASANDWNAYIESIGNLMASAIHVAGQFNGAGSVEYVVGQTNISYGQFHNAGFYSYKLSYEKAPATVYSASQKLSDNPLQANPGSTAITVFDPNASQYTNNQTKVTFTNAEAFSVFTAADLNAQHTVVNVIDKNHYQIIVGTTNATSQVAGGGTNVTSAVPLGSNPFSANAGDHFFTVTDPTAANYANEGVQVTFDDATAFAGFTDSYLNGTVFTITKVIDATHYEVATSSAAQTATGGGTNVAPTYVRPNAGTYVFTPDSNSQIKGKIEITTSNLANSIYSTLGSAKIVNPDGTAYQFTGLNGQNVGVTTTDMNTGFNNEWGAFFVKLLTGFIGGYYGSTATVANPVTNGPTKIDFSKNWNFDPSYAFHDGATTPWIPQATLYGNGTPYDKYAQIFFDHTNTYGNGYSDAVMSLFQQGGPLVPTGYAVPLAVNPFTTTASSNIVTVSDPKAGTYGYQPGDYVTFAGTAAFNGIDMSAPPPLPGAPKFAAFAIHTVAADKQSYTVTLKPGVTATGTGSGGGPGVVAGLDVPNINLSVYDDHETPPAGHTLAQHQKYTQTVIYNTSSGPFVHSSGTGASNDLDLQFGLGLGMMRPRTDLTVQLGFFDGDGGQGKSKFNYVEFDTSKATSLYQQWNYVSTPGETTPGKWFLDVSNGIEEIR